MTADQIAEAQIKAAAGIPIVEIAAALGIPPRRIANLVIAKKPPQPDHDDEPEVEDSRGGWIDAREQDDAFCDAMRRAISRGLESPIEGIFKDFTPLPVGTVFFPALRHSGCSSAAGLCAEYGDSRDWG